MKTCKDCTRARTCLFSKYEKPKELPIVFFFDCKAVNRKVSEKEIEQDIMARGRFYNVSKYYKPYFPDHVGKYKKFVRMTASQDFTKQLKKDVEKIHQIIIPIKKFQQTSVGNGINGQ